MQPSPRAETSELLFPSLRFCIVPPVGSAPQVRAADEAAHLSPAPTIRKCSPPSPLEFAYFAEVLAGSSEALPYLRFVSRRRLFGETQDPRLKPVLQVWIRQARQVGQTKTGRELGDEQINYVEFDDVGWFF